MKKNFACLDIGGTNIRFAIVENEKIVNFYKFEVDATNPVKTLEPIIELLKKYEIHVLGVSCPGPTDYEAGVLLNPPNLIGWHNFDLRRHFLINTQVEKMMFENDANIGAYAAHRLYNSDQKNGVTQFFTISTGLGSGLVVGQEIFSGYKHLGQEIAKIPLSKFETKDTWNLSPYALELFASGSGMVKLAKNLGFDVPNTKVLFTAYEVNPIATKVINEAIDTLTRLIAVVIGYTSPNYLVFGGSVAIYNKWFIKKAYDKALEYCWPNQISQVNLVYDDHGDNLCLLGLDFYMRDKYKEL